MSQLVTKVFIKIKAHVNSHISISGQIDIFYRLNTLTPHFLPFTGLQTAKLPQIRHSV